MSGGKGGETTTEIPPEFKQRILKTFDKGEALSNLAPIPYQGLTLAAPSDATKNWMTQTNDAANLLGVGMAGSPLDSLPANERDMGGMKGYRAHRGYVQELQRAHREYPEHVAALNRMIPGLLNPPKVHRDNEKMFPGLQGQGPAGGQLPPGFNYQDIIARYTGRFNR